MIRRALTFLGTLAVLAVTAYALSVMFEQRFAPRPWNLIVWLLAAAVLHDIVFLPAYSAVNVAVARLARGGPRGVPVLNHLRVPFVVAAVLLLVFLPRITDRQPQNFVNALGHEPPDYLGRWLFVVAVLFAGSALLFAVRWVRAGAAPDRAAGADAGTGR